jgi:hypothetical protein
MLKFNLNYLKNLNWNKGLYRLWIVATVFWILISILDTVHISTLNTVRNSVWKDIFSCSTIYFALIPPALFFAIIVKRSLILSLIIFFIAIIFPYVHHLIKYGADKHIALVTMVIILITIVCIILLWIFKGFRKQKIDNEKTSN